MLLDIAKESADVFPPLKSCLGFVDALIKHYDVRRDGYPTSDYADDRHPGVQRRERQTYRPASVAEEADDDPGSGEPQRRSARDRQAVATSEVRAVAGISHLLGTDPLDRLLEDIGTRATALLDKGKVARVLDKGRDSAEVVALVEKLRQAILIYQVSVVAYRSWRSFTPMAGVAAAVDIQPGHPIGREFRFLSVEYETEPEVGFRRLSMSF